MIGLMGRMKASVVGLMTVLLLIGAVPGAVMLATAAAQTGESEWMQINASGPNGHVIGARFTVTTLGGTFLGSCTLRGDPDAPYVIGCPVNVPRGIVVVVTLDTTSVSSGLVPVTNPVYFDTSSDPDRVTIWGTGFVLAPVGGTPYINELVAVLIQILQSILEASGR